MNCPFNKTELQNLYDEHRSVRAISVAVGGVTPRIVNRWMQQAGIKMKGGRPRVESHDEYLITYPKMSSDEEGCQHTHRFDYGPLDFDDILVEVCTNCGVILKNKKPTKPLSL